MKKSLSKSLIGTVLALSIASLAACGGGSEEDSNENYTIGNRITVSTSSGQTYNSVTKVLNASPNSSAVLKSVAKSNSFNVGTHIWKIAQTGGSSSTAPTFSNPSCEDSDRSALVENTNGINGVSTSSCTTDLLISSRVRAGTTWIITTTASSSSSNEELEDLPEARISDRMTLVIN